MRSAGQAMVETLVAFLILFAVLLAVFQFADDFRTKLLVEYAALRCARARTVGYNDYKLLKTERLALASASGKCLTQDDAGNALSTAGILDRMNAYLGAWNDGLARTMLDFSYWSDGRTLAPHASRAGNTLTVTTGQNRPQFFTPTTVLEGTDDDATEAHIRGSHTLEAHYPLYLK